MRSALVAAVLLATPAAAQERSPDRVLVDVLMTFAEAEICELSITADQRHQLAAAGLRAQGRARLPNPDLERLVATIGTLVQAGDCDRIRPGFAASLTALMTELDRTAR